MSGKVSKTRQNYLKSGQWSLTQQRKLQFLPNSRAYYISLWLCADKKLESKPCLVCKIQLAKFRMVQSSLFPDITAFQFLASQGIQKVYTATQSMEIVIIHIALPLFDPGMVLIVSSSCLHACN